MSHADAPGARAVTVELPIPPASLSPNGRAHWAERGRDARWWRTLAKVKLEMTEAQGWPSARMDIHWCFAGRQPDDDNVIARCKSIRDGAQDAGLVNDDQAIRVGDVTFQRVRRPAQCVVVTFTREDGR